MRGDKNYNRMKYFAALKTDAMQLSPDANRRAQIQNFLTPPEYMLQIN